jgi:hypothetical protein
LPLLAVFTVAISLCLHTMGPLLLRDPWNAWLTVLPFGVAVMAAWSALEGDRWGLWTLPVVASFLAQSHVGFLPVAVVLVATGVVGYARRCPARRDPLVAGAVLAVCWAPVLIDAITAGSGGNLARMAGHFLGGGSDDAPAGFATALGVAALELGTSAPWLFGAEEVNPAGGAVLGAPVTDLAVPVAAMAVAAVVAWRSPGGRSTRSLILVMALTTVTSIVAVSRISGGVFDYLVRWWWPLAVLWWTAVVWSIGRHVAGPVLARLPASLRRGVPVALIAVALVSAGAAIDASATGPTAERLTVDDWGPSMTTLERITVGRVPASGPVVVRNVGPLSGWAGDAYLALLARHGVDVRLDDTGINRYKVGRHRLRPPRGEQPVLWVVTGPWVTVFQDDPDHDLIGLYDPLEPAERATVSAAERRLRSALVRGGRPDLAEALDDGRSLWGASGVPGVAAPDLEVVEAARGHGVPVAVFQARDTSVPMPDRSGSGNDPLG